MSDMDLIIYIDDFFNRLEYVILFILEYIAPLAILVALFQYLREAPQRKRQAELNAWQVINSAMNQKAASGRVEALEYLNNAGVDLNFLDVHEAYLVGTTKEGKTRGINLPGAQLTGAKFTESTLIEANFRNRGINLPDAKLREANFAEATLTDANFRNADLFKANLFRANLEGANLWEVNLKGAKLEGAKLLGGANLEGANLDRANLKEAYLLRANLEGAKLSNTNLSGAKLERANLSGAVLKRVYLEGAKLHEANFEGANLEGADLTGAENITYDQLCKAKTLYKATLDSELQEKVKKECPELLVEPERGIEFIDITKRK